MWTETLLCARGVLERVVRLTVSHRSMENSYKVDQSWPNSQMFWYLHVTSFELLTLLTENTKKWRPLPMPILFHLKKKRSSVAASNLSELCPAHPSRSPAKARGPHCCSRTNTRLRGVLLSGGRIYPAVYRRVSPCPPLPLSSTTVCVATNRTGASLSSPPLLILILLLLLLSSAVSLGSTTDAASGTCRATRPISDGGHACVEHQTTRGKGRRQGREV